MAAPDELDLDPIDPVEETAPRAKGKNAAPKGDKTAEKPKAEKPQGKASKADAGNGEAPEPKRRKKAPDGDGDEPKPRKSVAGDRKVPYPPTPPNVPEGLTDYAESYTKQQNRLLAGLFVFLIFYIGMILLFAMVGFWCVWSLHHIFLLKVILLSFSGIFFLYLVKGFFKRHPMNKEMHIEITEEEQPVLFEFIYQLCDELGAPLPNKVFVSADVNAAVMPRTTLLNLFAEPKKDLLIGLGLVNSVNLSEFKAVLAHEFGHFSQSAMASSYTYVASRIIADLVEGEDWFDRFVNWCKKQENAIKVVGHAIAAPLWVGRKILEQFYKIITLQRLAVSREREFHADKVAVSAAGSNAVVHCLLRTEFGHQCFMQALGDMATAMDHKLYSNDMYLHQDRAAAVVRRKKKEPQLGLPPLLKTPQEGKDVEVFDAEEEEMTDEIPPMWRTHPSNSDREKNAKEEFVPAVVDNRSPWILFDEPAELKERMTYKFYRMVFRVPKNADLADAIKVQKFIDNEHADTTYDPKYKGAYDDRPLEPGELAELNALIREKPWDEERMEKVLEKLYDGCEEHAEAHSDLYKEMQSLKSGIVGRPSAKMKRKMEEVEKKQDENWEWFKSFDRRVYLLHVQMAMQADPETKAELIERYRFQLEVQRLYQESRAAFNKAEAYLSAYTAAARGEIQVSPDFPGEVIQVLRESWKALKHIIKDARDIQLPAMKNFEEGENLADFILEGKMVPEPPLSYVKGVWIDKLMTQLQGVRQKCFRLHFKSVGGVLRLHEMISAKWKAMREPVAAEVIADEPIAAEVIADEVIAAEVIEDAPKNLDVIKSVIASMGGVDAVLAKAMGRAAPPEVKAEELPEEPIEAEVIEAEVLPSEPAPAPPAAHAPEPPKAMAAFVAAPPAPSTLELHSPPVPAPAPAAPPTASPAPPPTPAPVVEVHKPEPVVAPAPTSAPIVEKSVALVHVVPEPPVPAPTETQPVPAEAAVIAPAATEMVAGEVVEVAAEVVAEPIAAVPIAPAEPSAPVAPAPVAPAPAYFSLDDEVETAPAPAPVKPVVPTPRSVPPAPSAPVAAEEVFSLDADEEPAPVKPAAPLDLVPVEEVFSLDADDHQPAPVAKTPASAPKAPSSVFPAAAAKPAGSTAVPAPPPRAPAAPTKPTKPTLSGVVDTPAAKPAFGSGTSPALVGKPANGKRPPIKITMVKPGEKSPLAK